jgi:uncharacterized protein (TIGR00266 family)
VSIFYRIIGDDVQVLEIAIPPQEVIKAEAGTMLYMEEGIQMDTGIADGLLHAVKRKWTGESFFMPQFSYHGNGSRAIAAFAAPHPGKIIPFELNDAHTGLICQKGAFVCSSQDVHISILFNRKLGFGLLSEEGFILQKLEGKGLAFLHAGGTVIEKELAAGEVLRADAASFVASETSIHYDITFVGGLKNAFWGGEGLFLIQLKGPGKVYLQSLPFTALAHRIAVAAKLQKSPA